MEPTFTEAELTAHLSDMSTSKLLETVGIFACAYEMVSSTVIDNVSGFFINGFDEDGWIYHEDWDDIRSKERHELLACLRWLVEQNVIEPEELAAVDKLRIQRNRFAHEFTEILTNPRTDLNIELLIAARNILKKIAVYFGGIEADMATAVGVEGEVDYEGIESGTSLLYAHVLRVWAGLPWPSEADAAPRAPSNGSSADT